MDRNKIDYPVDIPGEAREFIEALVQKDPNLRPKSGELLNYKLFSVYTPKNKNKKTWYFIHDYTAPIYYPWTRVSLSTIVVDDGDDQWYMRSYGRYHNKVNMDTKGMILSDIE